MENIAGNLNPNGWNVKCWEDLGLLGGSELLNVVQKFIEEADNAEKM